MSTGNLFLAIKGYKLSCGVLSIIIPRLINSINQVKNKRIKMARIKLDLPETFDFSTEIAVCISDVNYGGHLGHDSVLSLTHEARVRLLRKYGFTEMDIDGSGLIISDVVIVYKSEAFYGEILKIEIVLASPLFDAYKNFPLGEI